MGAGHARSRYLNRKEGMPGVASDRSEVEQVARNNQYCPDPGKKQSFALSTSAHCVGSAMGIFAYNVNVVSPNFVLPQKPLFISEFPLPQVLINPSRRRSITLQVAFSMTENPAAVQKKITVLNQHNEKLAGVLHDTRSMEIVVLCHGFRSSKNGWVQEGETSHRTLNGGKSASQEEEEDTDSPTWSKNPFRRPHTKMKFPRFEGGDALDLFSWRNCERTLLYWEELVKALEEIYGPAELQNPDEHLCSIQQKDCIQEYCQKGEINHRKVLILVDCGSTHNLVVESIVEKHKLLVEIVPTFGVQIGNGDIIRCNKVCRNLQILLPSFIITQDYYPFALGGTDLVFDVKWLASLNTIQANWKDMFIIFNWKGKRYKLQGMRSANSAMASLQSLNVDELEFMVEPKKFYYINGTKKLVLLLWNC
ncbi:hypothetical protein H5410_037091 [Solanum commersonii]|uniref:Uncharacterized protein n=1 Tax=Solanum commersonii TaxID=4109 RepID=A0A9J5Y5B1_SOLCO|nr:hypothetical protein H5410_037091 [Solanum commersonii]